MEIKKKKYDYFKTVKEKTEYIIDKYLNIPYMHYNEIELNFKENFYFLVLKIFDSEIYGRDLKFTKEEFNFYTTYNVDMILKETISLCQEDILYYKKQIKKAKGHIVPHSYSNFIPLLFHRR